MRTIDILRGAIRALCLLVASIAVAGPAFAVPVSLGGETANFCQTNFPITEAIDGSFNPSDGWAIDPLQGNTHVAVLKAASDLGGGAGTRLTFQFHMLWGDSHTIGRFRLSATTSDRSTYGQGTTCNDATPAGSANWTVLVPSSVNSANGQSLAVQPDGSVLASGNNPPTDVVTFQVTTPLRITGFRLEAMADGSFPSSGPGRAPNGNFVLTELLVDADSLNAIPALDAWAMALMALVLAGAAMVRLRQRA